LGLRSLALLVALSRLLNLKELRQLCIEIKVVDGGGLSSRIVGKTSCFNDQIAWTDSWAVGRLLPILVGFRATRLGFKPWVVAFSIRTFEFSLRK